MLCGGEALPRDLATRLLERPAAPCGEYGTGPTETTIWSSCAKIEAGDAPITVGHPIANTQFHLLDADDQPVPTGVPASCTLAATVVAKGYFRRDEATADRFIPDPFGLSPRLYRTGDVARRLADGRIQVLGRRDHQVKLRGFRIEVGEIEAVLVAAGGVAAAAVALREDIPGRQQLVGDHARMPGAPRSPEELHARLAAEVPDYMIPGTWLRLSRLPLSPNGKLDRAALPPPEPMPLDAVEFAAPETALEQALAAIWAEVLQIERVSRLHDLIRLGADSLHIFQIARAGEPSGDARQCPAAAPAPHRRRGGSGIGNGGRG